MAKKKKNNSLERKLIKQFRNNPNKEYNYKQVAAIFEITDTKKRNEIIKILNRLTSNKILSSLSKENTSYNQQESNIIKEYLT